MNPIEKAEELGMAILNSEEYRNFDEMQEKLDNNPEAQDLIKKFQDKQRDVFEQQRGGVEHADNDLMEELKDLQKVMLENETIKEYIMAKQKAERLLSNVNRTLTKVIGIPFGVGGSSGFGGCDCGCC